MRPKEHPKGCHEMHKQCDEEDEYCRKCAQRFTPPAGFLDINGEYTCLGCRTPKPVPA